MQWCRQLQLSAVRIKDLGSDLVYQLSDIEAELTYLRIRQRMPQYTLEMSPYNGFSRRSGLYLL